MSNPLTALGQIIAPQSPLRGVVVEVNGGIAQVATQQGLAEFPAPLNASPMDIAQIRQDGKLILPEKDPAIYWI